MIQEKPAVKLEDGSTIEPRHIIEIYCSNCGRDVDESELAALKCGDCGAELTQVKQSVSIEVTTKPIGSKIWGQ